MIVLRRELFFPSGVEGLMVLIFYIIRRVLFIPITLFGISLIVFSMIGMLSPYPVSYTHLDVYKRQTLTFRIPSGSTALTN